MFKLLKKLTSDTIIYGVGGLFSKGILLLLLPFYTKFFSPTEFGKLELILISSNLISIIMTMGLDSAQTLYFFDKKNNQLTIDRKELISSILQFRIFWGLIILLTSTFLVPLFINILFSSAYKIEIFFIAFLSSFFIQTMYQSIEIFRLLLKPLQYMMFLIFHSSLIFLFVLILIYFYEVGIIGVFLGTFLSSFIVCILAWFSNRRLIIFKDFYYKLWPKLLAFGAPLMPTGVCLFFMSTADRWFVRYYHGETQLGVFAVGAQVVLIFTYAIETFRKAWWPIAIKTMYEDNSKKIFKIISRLFCGLGFGLIVLFTFLSPYIIDYFIDQRFSNAKNIIGILSFQGFFYGFIMIASAGIWKVKKTKINLYIISFSFILGLLLNWFLVPEYGIQGASIATAITFFIWALISIILSEYYWSFNFDYSSFFLQFILSVLYVILSLNYSNYISFEIYIFITISIIVFLIFSSVNVKNWYLIVLLLKNNKG